MKEYAPEEASIARCGDFDSADFVIGRLRRRAFGGNLGISAGGATPEASDRGAVRFKIADFMASIRNHQCRGLPEVEFQQNIANWKAESLRNPISKELAPEDASIASYGDFESDRSAVGRLRRRVFGNSSKHRSARFDEFPKTEKPRNS